MNLIPWRPFWDLDSFFDEGWLEPSERSRHSHLKTPRMDIYETEKEVVAKVEMPGVEADDIDVEVTEDVLKIEAKSEQKNEEKEKGYYRKEIISGFYRRMVPLPAEVKGEKAAADYEGGVLTVTIPKAEPREKKEKVNKVKVKKKK